MRCVWTPRIGVGAHWAATMVLCGELAWLSPRRFADLLTRLADPSLDALHWRFGAQFDGAGGLADLAWFPAWLLIEKPCLARTLRTAQRFCATYRRSVRRDYALDSGSGATREPAGTGRAAQGVAGSARRNVRRLYENALSAVAESDREKSSSLTAETRPLLFHRLPRDRRHFSVLRKAPRRVAWSKKRVRPFSSPRCWDQSLFSKRANTTLTLECSGSLSMRG
jgi:hypothetical protein